MYRQRKQFDRRWSHMIRKRLKDQYKRNPPKMTLLQRVHWVFSDLYQRRDRSVNGPFRPGKQWIMDRLHLIKFTRKVLELEAELV